MPSTTPGFCSFDGSNVLPCSSGLPLERVGRRLPLRQTVRAGEPSNRSSSGAGAGALQHSLLLLLLAGHAAAIGPAGPAHVLALPRRAVGQVIVGVVAAVAEVETHFLAIGRVLQVLGKIAHLALRLLVDADHLDLVGHPRAAPLVAQHGRHDADRRHAFDIVAGDPPDLLHVPVGVAHALQRSAFEDHVADDAADVGLHLVAEAGHDAIDDDHRRHAQHDADDRREGDVSRAEVTPAEDEFVHGEEGLGIRMRLELGIASQLWLRHSSLRYFRSQ